MSEPVLPSPIEATVGRLGDAWTFVLLREAFFGTRRFDGLRERTGIPKARLAERLRRLVDIGLIVRVPYQHRPLRHEYRLTDGGLGTFPIAVALRDWGQRWCDRSSAASFQLQHRACGRALHLGLRRAYGEARLDPSTIRWPAVTGVDPQRRATRWRRYDTVLNMSWRDPVALAMGRVGDPWSLLVIREALAGAKKFRDFEALGIATNTLAARLSHLGEVGIIDRSPGPTYALTEAGRDLGATLVTLRIWGERWLPAPVGGWASIRDAGGRRIRPIAVCVSCQRPLDPREVVYERETAPRAS